MATFPLFLRHKIEKGPREVQGQIEFYLPDAVDILFDGWCTKIDHCKSHVKVLPEQTDQTSRTSNQQECTERTFDHQQWLFKAFDHKCSSKPVRLKTWQMRWIASLMISVHTSKECSRRENTESSECRHTRHHICQIFYTNTVSVF